MKELKIILKIENYININKPNKDILKILDPCGEDNWTEPNIVVVEKKMENKCKYRRNGLKSFLN